MTDYHTHILPMMDDGAASAAEALEMLAIEAQQGADTVYLTPHFYIDQNLVDDFLERRQQSFEALMDGVNKRSFDCMHTTNQNQQNASDRTAQIPKLKLGAEVFYFEGMATEENAEKIKKLKLEDTDYLLLEMPFTKWTKRMADDVLSIQSMPEITVLMAHIERYLDLTDMDTLFYLKRCGVEFQMNAEYINAGFFHRKAKKLLDTGLISIIASDAHNMQSRRPNLDLISKL